VLTLGESGASTDLYSPRMGALYPLPKSRRLLRAATESVDSLRKAQADPEHFEVLLPGTLASLDIVTSMVDKETAGARTRVFATWWTTLASDRRHRMMHKLRNDEFKEGNITHHLARFGQSRTVPRRAVSHGSQSAVIGGTDRLTHRARRSRGLSYTASHVSNQGTIVRITDSDHGGMLLMDFINEYLDWLTNAVLPTAEHLMVCGAKTPSTASGRPDGASLAS
jgi:hypothetical protein